MTDLSKNLKAQYVANVIKERKTTKQLADIHSPLPPKNLDAEVVTFLLEAAHWAPFHKPADASHLSGNLSSIVPWRCHSLDSSQCRSLLQTLKDWSSSDATWLKGKVPSMLAAASSLFIVSCLVNPNEGSQGLFEPSFQNMEIIAAASAAIQNLLLAATAAGLDNYWASAGTLQRDEILNLLGISKEEIILGAIFLFDSETENVTKHEGAWRHKRGGTKAWARAVHINRES